MKHGAGSPHGSQISTELPCMKIDFLHGPARPSAASLPPLPGSHSHQCRKCHCKQANRRRPRSVQTSYLHLAKAHSPTSESPTSAPPSAMKASSISLGGPPSTSSPRVGVTFSWAQSAPHCWPACSRQHLGSSLASHVVLGCLRSMCLLKLTPWVDGLAWWGLSSKGQGGSRSDKEYWGKDVQSVCGAGEDLLAAIPTIWPAARPS